jgi:hypothetical protein
VCSQRVDGVRAERAREKQRLGLGTSSPIEAPSFTAKRTRSRAQVRRIIGSLRLSAAQTGSSDALSDFLAKCETSFDEHIARQIDVATEIYRSAGFDDKWIAETLPPRIAELRAWKRTELAVYGHGSTGMLDIAMTITPTQIRYDRNSGADADRRVA